LFGSRAWLADGEDGAGGMADDAFGGAAEEDMFEAGIAVGAEDDEVGGEGVGGIGNFGMGVPDADEGFAGDVLGDAFPVEIFEALTSGLKEVLIGFVNSGGAAQVMFGMDGGFDDMKEDDHGVEAFGQAEGIIQGVGGAIGKVDRDKDTSDEDGGVVGVGRLVQCVGDGGGIEGRIRGGWARFRLEVGFHGLEAVWVITGASWRRLVWGGKISFTEIANCLAYLVDGIRCNLIVSTVNALRRRPGE